LEPRPTGAIRLTGTDWWRVRVGELRVVFQIDDELRRVVVLRVARRNEATYRRIDR
jgi:mRNA interferase RelE/StbE